MGERSICRRAIYLSGAVVVGAACLWLSKPHVEAVDVALQLQQLQPKQPHQIHHESLATTEGPTAAPVRLSPAEKRARAEPHASERETLRPVPSSQRDVGGESVAQILMRARAARGDPRAKYRGEAENARQAARARAGKELRAAKNSLGVPVVVNGTTLLLPRDRWELKEKEDWAALIGPFNRVMAKVQERAEWTPVYIEDVVMLKFYKSQNELGALIRSPFRTTSPEEAKIAIICCGPIDRLLSLPPRSPERPYLCYDCVSTLRFVNLGIGCFQKRSLQHGTCLQVKELVERRDVIFAAVDLRLYAEGHNTAPPLCGVTYAVPNPQLSVDAQISLLSRWEDDPPKYFLTFQGKWNVGVQGSSYARLNLAGILNTSKKPPKALKGPRGENLPLPAVPFKPPDDVVRPCQYQKQWINIASPDSGFRRAYYYDELFDSAYSLVARGHGRWSYRFLEVLHGGSIPVVMSDGWQLPFEELVDWDNVALRRPENLSMDPQALIDSLPRDAAKIKAMRAGIREAYDKYFQSPEKRAVAMLRSAVRWRSSGHEAQCLGRTEIETEKR